MRNLLYGFSVQHPTIQSAVNEGLTDLVKKMLSRDESLANTVIESETESSKYREWASPAEYRDCESVLELAVKRGWVDIVETLLKHGADPNYKTYDGKYGVMQTCKKYGNQEILDMLVEHGGIDDGTPLQKQVPWRSRNEERYGRSGNFYNDLYITFADDMSTRRVRDAEKAAKYMMERDLYKLVDKVLEVLKVKDFKDFVENHDSIFKEKDRIAKEDYLFILKDLEGGYCYADLKLGGPCEMLFFIHEAFRSSLQDVFAGYIAYVEKNYGNGEKPILADFMKKTYGEDYQGRLSNLCSILKNRYLKEHFPEAVEKTIHIPSGTDDRFAGLYRDFEKTIYSSTTIRSLRHFNWERGTTIWDASDFDVRRSKYTI